LDLEAIWGVQGRNLDDSGLHSSIKRQISAILLHVKHKQMSACVLSKGTIIVRPIAVYQTPSSSPSALIPTGHLGAAAAFDKAIKRWTRAEADFDCCACWFWEINFAQRVD
jgi:hypothetical protein